MTASTALSPAALDATAEGAGQPPRSFDPFRVLSREERRTHRAAYLRILEERDGGLDFEGRRLPRREEFFAALSRAPVRCRTGIDREAFFAHLYRTGAPPLDPKTLWALALMRTNEGESFGATGEIERYARTGIDKADPHEIYIVLEEQYHSRALVEACRALGVDVEFQKPGLVMRSLIRTMQYLPRSVRYVPILCGEVLACLVFRVLLETSRRFREEPEVEERLRTLLGTVMTDEILHVIYCRARAGSLAIRLSRLVLPLVALGLLSSVPELRRLGITPRTVLRELRKEIELPADLDWGLPEPKAA